ncbi:hypothetical protein LVD17_26280 [Fulvivirga ulvae]|uniref:hypothetical protein n=1 Tax=Fulvivirga ulvae TaxID=2904245 RepID=UPI001F289638|nr:hypothetical protein [Fulvivirga ulvae]UII31800.1 hypothetical protein LVD17_26280 [Fulvivirga ulvae]
MAVFTVIAMVLLVFGSHSKETKYPLIGKRSSLQGRVIATGASQSVAYVEIDNGYEFKLPYARNNLYTPFYLNRFIQVGDSLFKNQDSDTLAIIRNGDKFIFVLGEELNDIFRP